MKIKIITVLLLATNIFATCPNSFVSVTSFGSHESGSAAHECHRNCRDTCINVTPVGRIFKTYSCVPDYLPGDSIVGRFYDCCCKYGSMVRYCYQNICN